MKISELITKLQAVQAEHGNIAVSAESLSMFPELYTVADVSFRMCCMDEDDQLGQIEEGVETPTHFTIMYSLEDGE